MNSDLQLRAVFPSEQRLKKKQQWDTQHTAGNTQGIHLHQLCISKGFHPVSVFLEGTLAHCAKDVNI